MNNKDNLITKEFLEKEVNEKIFRLWHECDEKIEDYYLLNPRQKLSSNNTK